VLEVLYLIFNEGYAATSGEDWVRPELIEEALRLGRILAELLPEERAAGSDDPLAQAEAVLADSDERTEVPDAALDTVLERRTSGESADL